MLTKHGKFYADWRDTQGKRHRAAFPTRREAEEHQNRMRGATAHPHKPLAGRLRGQRSSSSKRKSTTPTPQPRSKKLSARSARKARAI